MRQIITGIIGVLLGAYLAVVYSITVSATVDDVMAERVPLSRLSRGLNGRRVKITGRLISEGEKTAIVDDGKGAVLLLSEAPVVSTEVERTYTGRLTELSVDVFSAGIGGKLVAACAIDVDAGLFSVKVVIGILVAGWGVVMIWAGFVARNAGLRLRRRAAATETQGAQENPEQ